ncbi:expressed unknown protein [Seminavis robusta]|uniref:Uncharacterized protein n=1 Tax=Seminavis robusta TaxID=568900 RepID=A0A9N8EK76_9STRA|nr:expressed unknown protein [Seminavis robusta]|eukprot:Sro1134_g244970.1 n/a (371) ;mRNA; r:30574-31686
MIRPDLPLEQQHPPAHHSPAVAVAISGKEQEETIEEDDDYDVRLGHSRIATTLLDGHIPKKRPRMSTSLDIRDDRPFFVFEHEFPQSSNKMESSSSQQQQHDDDDDSSCGWSLRPLAPTPNSSTTAADPPQQQALFGHNNTDNTCMWTSNHHSMERWRSMSSFSSTITERSTEPRETLDGSSSGSSTQPQPVLHVEQPLGYANNSQQQHHTPTSTNTGTTSTTSSRRKNRAPQQLSSDVEQLTARLDHWCSINNTHMTRALQRRNNIYTPEHHKSALYNPQEEYDYSHFRLSKQIRKLQCQNAKQEVMRAMIMKQQHGMDENTSPMSSAASNGGPSTPTISNTTTLFASTSPTATTTTDKATADVVMGDN